MGCSAGRAWRFRSIAMLDFEKSFYSDKVKLIAGTDEAGRGPLAGPVFVAAVIFDKGYENPDIDDSKKLSEKKRLALFEQIKKDALAYSIVSLSPEKIDEINIYEASRLGMKMAIDSLSVKPDLALTDAMPLPGFHIPYVNLVKGDAKCLCIAAASILAKVSRDLYMDELGKCYPNFSFSKHKGYGTKKHLQELAEFGPIKGVHRFSFEPVRQTNIFDFLKEGE